MLNSAMGQIEKEDAIKSIKAGEKRARLAYEIVNSKAKKVANADL